MLLRKTTGEMVFAGSCTRILKTVALLLFTVCVLVSCGKGAEPTPSDEDSTRQTEPSETTPPADAKWYLMRTDMAGAFAKLVEEYSYNELGQKIGYTMIVNGDPQIAESYEYDDLGRVVVELSTSAQHDGTQVTTSSKYSYEGENPVFTTKEVDNGSEKLITRQEFDDEMRLIRSEIKKGDEATYGCTYKYLDENGSYEQYDLTEMFSNKMLYDEKGNLIEELMYSNGECYSHVVYEFNERNQEVKEISYDGDSDVILSMKESEYDESGLLVKDTRYSGSENVTSMTLYTYDEYQNLIKVDVCNAQGEPMDVYTHTYSTDPASF